MIFASALTCRAFKNGESQIANSLSTSKCPFLHTQNSGLFFQIILNRNLLILIIESNECNQQSNLNTGKQFIWTNPEFPGRGDMALFSLQLLFFFLTPFKFTLSQFTFLQHILFFVCEENFWK